MPRKTPSKASSKTTRRFISTPGRVNSWAVAGIIGAFAIVSGLVVYTSFAATAPKPVGPTGTWKLKFADEFSGSKVDTSKWADHSSAEADRGHGNTGNKQLEWNQLANCSVSRGVLVLTSKRDSSHKGYGWTSCLLTAPKFSFRYGYIEERAAFPAARGFWPAFWTWQADGVNKWNETDVFEYYSDNPTKLYLTQHAAGKNQGCDLTPKFKPNSGYHVYGADIEPSGTTWYFDGVKVCHTSLTSQANSNLITNLAVFKDVPPASSTSKASMGVDYIRVWQH